MTRCNRSISPGILEYLERKPLVHHAMYARICRPCRLLSAFSGLVTPPVDTHEEDPPRSPRESRHHGRLHHLGKVACHKNDPPDSSLLLQTETTRKKGATPAPPTRTWTLMPDTRFRSNDLQLLPCRQITRHACASFLAPRECVRVLPSPHLRGRLHGQRGTRFARICYY